MGQRITTQVASFSDGLPYNRMGDGERPLIVFQGLLPDPGPMTGMTETMILRLFRPLVPHYTIYVVNRKPGLAPQTTLADMADDYATMIRREFDGPVDVVGLSTGGSIAQIFAAEHPELVDRLVIYSSAYRLGDAGRAFQRRMAVLSAKRRWIAVMAESFGFMFLPRRGILHGVTKPLAWLVGLLSAAFVRAPADLGDYIVTIEAEDTFDFRSRLGEIRAPTLVIGGGRDPFYSPELSRETADGIPNARLTFDAKAGHAPSNASTARELLAFLGRHEAPAA